jgi:hypothetical protein
MNERRYRITTNTGREKTGCHDDAIECTQSMLLRKEGGRREVMLQRCDTESITITLGVITEGRGNRRKEGRSGEERRRYMLNRHNHIRINHERIRAQAARLDETNLFRIIKKPSVERRVRRR